MSIYDKASLVLIPSGTKTSKVYSQKPVNGDGDFTFSRSTAATRVNASGNIEKETQNRVLKSNAFDSGTWNKSNVSVTGGQSDKDGGNDAWLLSNTSAGGHINQPQTSDSGQVITISVYAKAGTLNWLRITEYAGSNVWFDLGNGVVAGTTSGSNFIASSITDVGGGWYRCTSTTIGGNNSFRFYPATYYNDESSLGNIYIQDAQRNSGLIAQDYIETDTAAVEGGITDNVPRLDYTDSSCPALLLEPQRTNSYTNSEYFDDWLSNRLDRTANNIISPEGVQNAYKMAQQSGFTTAPNINKGGVAAGTYTISIFAKKGSWNYLAISFQGVSYFNLETGSKGTINSNHTATIEDYGNGWYRCAITRTTTTTQTPAFYFAESDNTLTTPDTQGYMYTFGAQLEASASYATSYIPCMGTSVTRNADDCDVSSVSSLIGQEQGTFFIEWENIGDTSRPYLALSAGGSTANRVLIYESSGVNAQVKSSGSVVFQSTTASVSGTIKAAVAYNTNDFVFYVNGTQYGTDSSGATFSGTTLNKIEFDHAGLMGASIKKSMIFKTRTNQR